MTTKKQCIMLMYSHTLILHLKPFSTSNVKHSTMSTSWKSTKCLSTCVIHVRSWWAHQECQCSCFYCGPPPQQWAYCLMRAPLGHGERPRAFVIIVITVSGNQGPTCHLSSPPHRQHCRGDLQDTRMSVLSCSASVCVCGWSVWTVCGGHSSICQFVQVVKMTTTRTRINTPSIN